MEQRRYHNENGNDYASSRSYYNGNAAYDLSLFEGRPVTYQRSSTKKTASGSKTQKSKQSGKTSASAKKSRAASKKNVSDRAILVRWIAIGMILTCAVGMLISSRMKYLEITQEINNANSRLEALQQDYEGLRVTFETKMSNSAIEEYASDVLGMQKRENSQTEWISLGGGDVFEYTGGNDDSRFQEALDELLSYMD